VVVAAEDVVEGRAVVVGEGIVVAVEGFDRFEGQGRRIHRTVVVAPGLRRLILRDHRGFVGGELGQDRLRIGPSPLRLGK